MRGAENNALDEGALSAPDLARAQSRFSHLMESERERFFLWAPVALGIGIAAYFALPVEPAITAAAAPLAVAIFIKLASERGSMFAALSAALVIAAAGFLVAKLRVEAVRAPVIVKAVHAMPLTGVVVRTEAKPPKGQRLTIAVESLGDVAPQSLPAFVRVRTMSNKVVVSAGDRIRIKANLKPPSKPALPGGFDYARLSWFERVGAVGYAFQAPEILGHENGGSFGAQYDRFIENLRQGMSARIRASLPGETGAIATALITGERGGITAETNGAFKNSGLFHILSISGLHMVIMAGAVFYCVRLLLAAVPLIALTLPIKKIAAVAGIVGALAYLAISGGAFATVRSAVTIVIIFGAVLVDRPALALRNVALAAFLILLIYPESLLDAGFQMSFAAVTALIATHEAISRRLRPGSAPIPGMRAVRFVGEIIVSTLIASAAVAPFAAYHFHQSQQYAVLANVLAVPICNFLVMPAALAAVMLMPFGLEGLALYPMGLGIDVMTWCANAVAALPGAVGHIKAMPALAFALMVSGGLWLALWGTRVRFIGGALVACGVLWVPWLRLPDILVADGGRMVAVRDSQGQLSAMPGQKAKFEVERWLEYDGDGRTAAEAAKGGAFTCDTVGCVARVKSMRIAVAQHPAAVMDDCTLADILVISDPRPTDCATPRAIIDVFDVWRNGTHALFIETGGGEAPWVRIETVAAGRGERPWSVLPLTNAPRQPRLPKPVIRAAKDNTPPHAGDTNGVRSDSARQSLNVRPESDPAEDPDIAEDAADIGD